MNFGFVLGGISINSKHELMLRPITGDLRKIYLYHDRGGVVTGLQFFGADGDLIYESEYKGGFTYSKFEILLAEGERIIGFQSRKEMQSYALHSYLQFIIGS